MEPTNFGARGSLLGGEDPVIDNFTGTLVEPFGHAADSKTNHPGLLDLNWRNEAFSQWCLRTRGGPAEVFRPRAQRMHVETISALALQKLSQI